MTIREAALSWAQAQLGVRETSQNSGPEIDAYLASVGLGPGYAWCAAFVHWCFVQGAIALGVDNPCPRTASTLQLWAIGRSDNFNVVGGQPLPGDVYVLQHSPSTGHAGFVETVADDGSVATEISGNTFSDRGGREGNCVARHAGPPEVTHGGALLGYLRIST